MIFILPYGKTPNPMGYPPEYPRERTESESAPDRDWVEVTEDEYQKIISRHSANVAAINSARKETQEAEAKAEQVEKLAQLEVIKVRADEALSLTDRQRLDVIPSILKLLAGLQSQIEDLIKR